MKTTKHEDKDLKKEFQIERLVLFSDAVFAIAITLLIIELHVPEITTLPYTDKHLLDLLSELIPKFIGFLVSFIVIAMYWINHHLLFGLLHNYNRKIIWANLRFLFTIVLMPFSSAFYSEYWNRGFITPIAFYAFNITLSGFAIMRLWNIITNPANHLCAEPQPAALVNYYKARSLVAASVFMASFFIAFFNPGIAYIFPIVIPVVMYSLKAYYRKKAPHIFHKGSDH
jgi:uncharacterized membrane protein